MRAEIHHSYAQQNQSVLSLLETGVEAMKVLVGCEYSGIVRNAFADLGHDAWSCDIIASDDNSPKHLIEDVRNVIHWNDWDLAIFHPPCTYLAVSGIHWNTRVEGREEKTREAIEFVQELMDADIPRICIENPRSVISSRIRPADQMVHPYHFGEPYTKGTCLWLKNLRKLEPTNVVAPVGPYPEFYLGPNDPDRAKKRSRFFHGMARAMAEQWSHPTLEEWI